MNIDFVYIINLNTSSEEITKKINQVPWIHNINYYILPAINGWEIVKDPTKSPIKFKVSNWWNIEHINSFYNRDVTPGEIGCMLSHYQCIESIYK